MREIKFRAWDKIVSKMRTVAGIDLFVPRVVFSYKEGVDDFIPKERMLEDCILMQYTGLQDKNGKEIYEGDILRRWINSRGTTYPSNSKIHMIVVSWNKNSYNIKPILMDRLEIIGNIYENVELLSVNHNQSNEQD